MSEMSQKLQNLVIPLLVAGHAGWIPRRSEAFSDRFVPLTAYRQAQSTSTSPYLIACDKRRMLCLLQPP
jgi:hypothetical protein